MENNNNNKIEEEVLEEETNDESFEESLEEQTEEQVDFDEIEKQLDAQLEHTDEIDSAELKKLRKNIDKFFTFAIGFLLTGIFLCICGANTPWCFIPGFVIIIAGIAFIVVACSKRSKYVAQVKEEYLKKKINEKFPDLIYEPKKGYEKDYINELHVYSEPFIFESEDYFEGKIEDVNFSGADVCMKKTQVISTGKTTMVTYITTFLGRVFTFDYNKRFDGEVLVTEKNLHLDVKKELGEQKLESIEFNKKFEVYANEPINAFYILTPDFMERIMDIESKYQGDISILFKENHVYVFINDNVDTFDNVITKELNEEQIEIMMNDVEIFKDLILELRLNEKIYK